MLNLISSDIVMIVLSCWGYFINDYEWSLVAGLAWLAVRILGVVVMMIFSAVKFLENFIGFAILVFGIISWIFVIGVYVAFLSSF